jgi:hypothetical protein
MEAAECRKGCRDRYGAGSTILEEHRGWLGGEFPAARDPSPPYFSVQHGIEWVG